MSVERPDAVNGKDNPSTMGDPQPRAVGDGQPAPLSTVFFIAFLLGMAITLVALIVQEIT